MPNLDFWLRYWTVQLGPVPEGIPPEVDQLLVLAFGRRYMKDDDLPGVAALYRYCQATNGDPDRAALSHLWRHHFDAGPINDELAIRAGRYLSNHKAVVFMQWEVAAAMGRSAYLRYAHRIVVLWPDSGTEFNTLHVIRAAMKRGFGRGRLGIMTHDWLALRGAVMVHGQVGKWPVVIPSGVKFFDSRSSQPQTTDLCIWWPREAYGRLIYLPVHGLM